MTRVIVERRFDGPVSDADLQAVFDRQTGCFQIYNVAYVRGNLSMDRLRMICEYEAADTESVRRVHDRLHIHAVIEIAQFERHRGHCGAGQDGDRAASQGEFPAWRGFPERLLNGPRELLARVA